MKKQNEILARLSDEDLRRWRMNTAKTAAQKIKPEAYSREEIEQTEFERMRLGGELLDTYGIAHELFVSIQTWTGTIEVDED